MVLNEFRHYGFEVIYKVPEFKFIESSLLTLKRDTVPVRNLDNLYKYINNTGDYHYGWYFVSQFVTFIPRAIWEEKPITSFPFAYTKKVYNIDPVKDLTTHTFTMFDSYAWLGWGTLLFVSFFVGIFSGAIYRSMWNRNIFFLLFAVPYIVGFLSMIRASFIEQVSFFIVDIVIITFIYLIFRTLGIVRLTSNG